MTNNTCFELLIALCTGLAAVDFVYHRHGYTAIEESTLFYVGFSLLACIISGLISTFILSPVVSRKEDYYDR